MAGSVSIFATADDPRIKFDGYEDQSEVIAGEDMKLKVELFEAGKRKEESSSFNVEEDLNSIEIGYFDELVTPALELELQEGWGEDRQTRVYEIAKGLFSVVPISKASAIPSFICDSIRLESMDFGDGTRVMFTVPEEPDLEDSRINIDVKVGNVLGEVSFSEKLDFEVNNSIIKGVGDDIPLRWASGRAKILENSKLPFKFSAGDNLFLTLLPNGSLSRSIKKQSIIIDSLRLEREERGDMGSTVSSIVKGQLYFLTQKDKVFQEIEVSSPDYLRPLDYGHLEVTSMNLNIDKIDLQLIGKIDSIFTGPSKNNMSLQNPTILQWFRHNHPSWIILVPAFAALLTISLLLYTRRKI